MNDPAQRREILGWMFKLLIQIGFYGIITLILLAFFEVPFHLGFGWIFYLARTLHNVRLDLSLIAQFTLASMAFLILGHFLIRSLLRQSTARDRWNFDNSILLLLAIFTSFAAGLAFVGTFHQLGWLTREPRIFDFRNEISIRMQTRSRFKEIGKAVEDYQEKWNSFPVGGTLVDHAVPGHSCLTHLLPYLDQQALFNQIDHEQPWFAVPNKNSFSTTLTIFNNPAFAESLRQEHTGYALSHYAINSRLANLGESIKLNDIRDGAAHTLLAGGVADNFKPWGDPTNSRDPFLGLNTAPNGFGTLQSDSGTIFLMADGTSRTISNKIDPKILKALATPNGGEQIPEDW